MSTTIESPYIVNGSHMKRNPRKPVGRETLIVDYQTHEDNAEIVHHCLFSDETFLTALTQKAYKILVQYFQTVHRYKELPQPDGGPLVLGVETTGDHVSFYAGFSDFMDMDYDKLVEFTNALNNFAFKHGNDIINNK